MGKPDQAAIGERFTRMRELYDMTQDEVAALGGSPGQRAQIARVEGGLSQLRSHDLREMLRVGYGLDVSEFAALTEGRMTPEDAHALGAPRIADRLIEFRKMAGMRAEDLELAIRRVTGRRVILESVLQFAREGARTGVIRSSDEWEEELERIDREFRKKQREMARAKRIADHT